MVQYVKEERDPHGQFVSEVIALAGPELKGVFTGGHLLAWCTATGAARRVTSPAARSRTSMPDLGPDGGSQEAEARKLQDLECTFLRCIQTIPGQGTHKRVLVRRGVFSSDACAIWAARCWTTPLRPSWITRWGCWSPTFASRSVCACSEGVHP